MYVAQDRENKIYNALEEDIEKNKEYFCPVCHSKVIYKKCIKKESHFAHEKLDKCTFNDYKRESIEHLNTKKDLYIHFKNKYEKVFVEYIFPVEENIQIADVYIQNKNIAIEYQRSQISFDILDSRTKGYTRANIKLIWLIDIDKFVKEKSFKENIFHITYKAFVNNFLNYKNGKVFFYGWSSSKRALYFYELYSISLTKNTALCKRTKINIDDFTLPLNINLSNKDYKKSFTKSDIENYVYTHLKYDKSVKNKILSMFYNQKIALNNIPEVIGKNFNENLLISTPCILWQGYMYKFFLEKKTYNEIFSIMVNNIKLYDSVNISKKEKLNILEKVIKSYYNILLKKMGSNI